MREGTNVTRFHLYVVGALTALGTAGFVEAGERAGRGKGIRVEVPAGFQPAVEEVPGVGSIDWARGVAVARGQAAVKRPGLKLTMLRLAKVRAMRNVLALMGQMRIDSTRDLKRLADQRRTIDIKGFVRQFAVAEERFVKGRVKTYWEVVLRVPFYGVTGLSVYLYDHVALRPLAQHLRDKPWRRGQVPPHLMPPVIVIDARGVDAQAVLYPKLADNLGAALMDLDSRDPQVAVNEGVATFVTPADDEDDETLWRRLRWAVPRYRFCQGERADTQLACVGAGVPWGLSLVRALLPSAARRVVTVKASGVRGTNKGTVVLDAATAGKLRADAQVVRALRGGQVYIVVRRVRARGEGGGGE